MEVQGAEAVLEIDGEVTKKRVSKNYRHNQLDTKIRKQRTEKEANIMREARKHGTQVPKVEQKDEYTLQIEKIDGEQLKDSLKENLQEMTQMGENTAKLHGADIIHGDLTTRNAMLSEKIYLIDFGLSFRSQRIEDRAIDIHLLKQVLESSHPEVAEDAWQNFLEGYRDYENSDQVLERLKEVEKRGRYK